MMVKDTPENLSRRYNTVQFLRLCGYSYEELATFTDFELYSLFEYEDNKLYEELE